MADAALQIVRDHYGKFLTRPVINGLTHEMRKWQKCYAGQCVKICNIHWGARCMQPAKIPQHPENPWDIPGNTGRQYRQWMLIICPQALKKLDEGLNDRGQTQWFGIAATPSRNIQIL